MTVQNNVPLNQYVGDAVNDTFAFTFQILDNQFLKVTVDGVFQTENFDYTVENITSIGGDVVFINTPGNDKRPGVGAEVALYRSTTPDQQTVYNPYDPFPAKTHERALDKLTMLIQEIEAGVGGGPDLTLYTQRAANEAITGQWQFTQTIIGATDGNPTFGDIANFVTSFDNETITGQWTFAANPLINAGTATTSAISIGNIGAAFESRVRLLNSQEPAGLDLTLSGTAKTYGFFDRGRNEWAMQFDDNTRVTFGTRRVNGANAIDAGDFVTFNQIATANWVFTGTRRHNATLSIGNNVTLSGWNAANSGTISLAFVDPNNVVQLSSPSVVTNLRTSGDLRLNNAQLNQPNGLVQVQANGKIPFDLTAFSALAFIGTWDASGGTNPPNGTEGGQFYVIIKGGDLLVFVDDSGTPVLTTVSPGDYLLWLGAGSGLTPGWYHIVSEAPTLVDSANVFYDPSTAPWTNTIVQDVLDEIGDRATLRDRVETISASWTFDTPVNLANTSVIVNSASGAMLGFNAIGNAGRSWRIGNSGADNNDFILYNDVLPGAVFITNALTNDTVWGFNMTFSQPVSGVAATVAAHFPTLGQTDGRYGRKDSPETINTLWNFTTQPTFNTAPLATEAYVDAKPGFDPASDQAITGSWSFSQPLIFNVSSFAVIQQFNEGTDGLVFEHTTIANGSARIKNRRGGVKKVGFRNPGFGTVVIASRALTQDDEGDILTVQGTPTITVNSLEIFTSIRLLINDGATVPLVAGTASIRWHDGSGTAKVGDRVLAGGSVVELYWSNPTNVVIFGNGIS